MKHIIIVEDNENDLFFTKRTLAKLGINTKIISFESALSFLQYVDENELKETKLIILDLNLPDMQHKELILRLHESILIPPPLLILTGMDAKYRDEMGLNNVMIKPLTPSEFMMASTSVGIRFDII